MQNSIQVEYGTEKEKYYEIAKKEMSRKGKYSVNDKKKKSERQKANQGNKTKERK